MTSFAEIAPGVWVLRYPTLDVNSTLIVGSTVAVVVDTLATAAQGRELVDAIRKVTDLPLEIVNTHWHFDHCFGNAAVADASLGGSIWAHESTVEAMREHTSRVQRAGYDEALRVAPSIAVEVAATELRGPDRGVAAVSKMDIGGRKLELRHFGRGHTAWDIIVHVPDVSVIVAGDLVEEGAPPSFDDAYPLDWPDTLTEVLALKPRLVVPGHGAVVDAEFVHEQRAQLSKLEWMIREGDRDNATPEAVAAQPEVPFGPEVALVAVRRGYADLSGRL